jgi:hypothetical protein
MNYPPIYFQNQGIQKHNFYQNYYGLGNNVQRRAKYRRKYHKKYSSESDYSKFSDSTENCGTCSCNECYKSKPCCKSVCKGCKSLILAPYPVPYLIPDSSSEKTSLCVTTEKTTLTTTKTTTTSQKTTTVEKESTSQTTKGSSTVIQTDDVASPSQTKITRSTLQYPFTNNYKLKKKLCPNYPKGACVPKQTTIVKEDDLDHLKRPWSFHNLIKRPTVKYQNKKTKQQILYRRVNTIASTKPYEIFLHNIIPIPDELAEKILSEVEP